MRHALRLVLFVLLFLSGPQPGMASLPKDHFAANPSPAVSPLVEVELQVPELRLDNPLLYGESDRITLWTKFDPEGLFLLDLLPPQIRPIVAQSSPYLVQLDHSADVGMATAAVYLTGRSQGSSVAGAAVVAAGYGTANFTGALGVHDAISGDRITANSQGRTGIQGLGTFDRAVSGATGLAQMALLALGAESWGKSAFSEAPTSAPEGSAKVTMEHGTTLARAQEMAANGPDPNFVEPGRLPTSDAAKGFSAAKPDGPFPMGSPTDYALGKAAAFPAEGGPAILRMTMPPEVANFGLDIGGEIRFNKAGADALKFNWDQVQTEIRPVDPVRSPSEQPGASSSGNDQ